MHYPNVSCYIVQMFSFVQVKWKIIIYIYFYSRHTGIWPCCRVKMFLKQLSLLLTSLTSHQNTQSCKHEEEVLFTCVLYLCYRRWCLYLFFLKAESFNCPFMCRVGALNKYCKNGFSEKEFYFGVVNNCLILSITFLIIFWCNFLISILYSIKISVWFKI